MKWMSLVGAVVAITSLSVRAEIPAADWPRMTDIAKRHGLPMPGTSAQLALIHTESWSVIGNRSSPTDPANYTPGWALETLSDGSLKVLVGSEVRMLKPRKASEPLQRRFSPEPLKPKAGGYAVEFSEVSVFVTAVQCAARGDLARANALWQRFFEDGDIRDGFAVMRYGEGKGQPEQLLAAILFDSLELEIASEGSDLKAIERKMRDLMKDFPGLADQRRKDLLGAIKLTNEAPVPAAGSVEALLIESGGPKREGDCCGGDLGEEPQTRIVRMGFDAIPDLLKLSQDKRLTSRRRQAIMNSPSAPVHLGDLADAVLRQLLPPFEPPSPFGWDSSRPDYKAEWTQARRSSEMEFYTRAALARTEKGAVSGTRAAPLVVVARKFPERLPELFRTAMKESSPDASAFALFKAVATSSLPQAEKLALLEVSARSGNLENRTDAVRTIGDLDAAAAVPLALDLVRSLPRDAKGTYCTSPEAAVSHLVLATNDDAVWQEFLRVSRGASVGLRLEWMNPFNYIYVGDRLKKRRLMFLAAFLDDASVRDSAKNAAKYEGPCAAFTFDKISVRNFAAEKIASILTVDPLNPPDSTWTEARWSELRAAVRTRLESEGIRPLGTP